VEIRHARSATRHRISRRQSAYVARHPQATFVVPAPAASPQERIVFLGADEDGTVIEVMAVQSDRGLVIIHAMAIRDRYRPYLQSPTEPNRPEGDDDA
jgi:hypothetical protein